MFCFAGVAVKNLIFWRSFDNVFRSHCKGIIWRLDWWIISKHNKLFFRSSCPEVFYKKEVLKKFKNFTGINLCRSLFFDEVATLFKKQTPAQVLSCEFCETFKNTLFRKHIRTTASVFFSQIGNNKITSTKAVPRRCL